MGVNVTGAIYKGLTFNGFNSKDFGVYITGEAVYNAPERDVEMIDIPGRNGSFARDNGRFNNIIVEYTAGMFGDAQTDFAEGISEFRNALCASVGYCRLEDEYNPDEYREAVYKSGLDVSPELMGRAGEFKITFECKPQRFLKSGEIAQTIAASGDTLANPTRFSSRPLLEVTGYGKIGINEDEVEIISGPIGRTPLLLNYRKKTSAALNVSFLVTPNYANMNSGDSAKILGGNLTVDFGVPLMHIYNFSQTGGFVRNATGLNTNVLTFGINNFAYEYGTAKTASATVEVGVDTGDTTAQYANIAVNLVISAAGVMTVAVSTGSLGADGFSLYFPQIYGNSTKSALGDPVYIDLDIGEAYKIEGGAVVGVNSAVSLGGELPELQPGENEITFDGTVTALKIKPRWWKV